MKLVKAVSLVQRLERLPFDFRMDAKRPRAGARGSLGVTTMGLTGQLASCFGAKEGVLVAAGADDSPADLVGAVRLAEDGSEPRLGIVRERKEMSVTVMLERRRRPSAPARAA